MTQMTLRAARVSANMTQDDMSKALGVNINTYSKWERNPETVTIKDAMRICKLVNRSFDEIIFIDNEV